MQDLYEILDARWRRPVPLQDGARKLKEGYRDHTINLHSPVFREPMIDVRTLGVLGANHYWLAQNPPVLGAIEGLFLRRTVAQRLKGVDDCLSHHGLGLFVKDAYRPLVVQEHISRRRPDLAAAPEGGEDSPPPHLTGAALDVVIVKLDDGSELNMGRDLDQQFNVYPDFFEQKRFCGSHYPSTVEQEARGNRRLLVWLMTESGFVVNPTEYWHFSCGDQMWARLSGEPAALYGLVTLP